MSKQLISEDAKAFLSSARSLQELLDEAYYYSVHEADIAASPLNELILKSLKGLIELETSFNAAMSNLHNYDLCVEAMTASQLVVLTTLRETVELLIDDVKKLTNEEDESRFTKVPKYRLIMLVWELQRCLTNIDLISEAPGVKNEKADYILREIKPIRGIIERSLREQDVYRQVGEYQIVMSGEHLSEFVLRLHRIEQVAKSL